MVHVAVVVTGLLTVVAAPQIAAAQRNSDARVRASVFGEAVLATNASEVCRQVRSLPDEQKFERLLQWVFPNSRHARLRLDGEFGSVRAGSREEVADHQGAKIESPVLLLVDLAAELGRLEELRSRLKELEPRHDLDARSLTALRFLVELADGDSAAARASLGRLFDQFVASSHSSVDERWPETLATTRGIPDPQTRRLAGELLDAMTQRLIDDVDGWRSSSFAEWDLHLRAIGGWRLGLNEQAQAGAGFVGERSLRSWAPVSRQSARSVGDGYPRAVWLRNGPQVRHLAGHWRDYLWFRSPLAGDYQLECEVSAQAWHEVHLMAAGIWNGVKWDGRGFSEGTFLKTGGTQLFDERMARFGEWCRARAVLHDGICSFYFNGRKIAEHPVTDGNLPWLALRVNSSSHGVFRDVRITGNPEIPERLDLIRGETLEGWSAPLGETVSTASGWSNVDGELVGVLQGDQLGTVCENLLTYCRPMLEDGEMEYEFLYEPGQVEVSPVIGRTVFLIGGGGVRLHRVTSGRFERGGLEPDNRSDVISEVELPLVEGQWNRARLVLRGDELTLELNGEEAARHTLTTAEQRSFGLFHFADQTEARVRNVVWRGDWPRELPPVAEQELAAPEPDYLAGLDRLKEVVTYQFVDGIPTEEFELVGSIDAEPRPNGLLLSPPVKSNWSSGRFTWQQPIYGDFDIALRVSGLKQEYGEKGTLVVELAVVDDADTVVGCVRSRGARDRINLVAKKSIRNPNGTRQYSGARVEDELEDGTLRIVRRGAEIHALAAHGDSSNFRHVGSNRLPSALSPVKLQLVVASTGGGHTEVVFQELTIRSNSKAVEERLDPNVVAVNQYVAAFKWRVQHDFADDGLTGFSVAGAVPVKTSSQGLVIRAEKGSPSKPVTLTLDAPVSGEFDMAASLQLLDLPVNAGGAAVAELSFAVPGDVRGKVVDLAVFKTASAAFRVEARSRMQSAGVSEDAGGEAVVIASAEAASVEQLRVIRIQQSLLFVFSEDGVERLLGQTGCGEGDLPAGAVALRTRVTAGEQSVGEVRWKQFSVSSSAGR